MTEDKIKILSDLKVRLKDKFKDDFKELVLFGSLASGLNNKWSYFDVLILVKNKLDWKRKKEISDICYDFELKYGILTDSLVLSEPELDTPQGKQPIFINALKHGHHA